MLPEALSDHAAIGSAPPGPTPLGVAPDRRHRTATPDAAGRAATTGDELPEDLDVTAYVGPYLFPNIRRRRVAGTIYAVLGASRALAGWTRAPGTSGLLGAGVLLALIGGYHFARRRGTTRRRPDRGARGREPHGRVPGRPRVGAARLARPALAPVVAHPALLSADEPPSHARPRRARRRRRSVLGEYTEENPEDWSQYGLDRSRPEHRSRGSR